MLSPGWWQKMGAKWERNGSEMGAKWVIDFSAPKTSHKLLSDFFSAHFNEVFRWADRWRVQPPISWIDLYNGKNYGFWIIPPKEGFPEKFLRHPKKSHWIPWVSPGFSYVFPTNFMAFRPRIPRLLQGARPHQGSRTETGSILVAGAGTMPLAASAMVIWEVLPNKTPLEGNTLWKFNIAIENDHL